ncbi:MAG: phosphoenolpyruvate--protein phosphotransferase [Bdellovibrionales bacterium]|nr:phosphoenolpyruvate--protein phosphotransferase [Bdellovibrionales bacterium]
MNSTNSAIELLAPVSGPVLPIGGVPDPVFAQKIVGPGVAVDPTTQVLLSPADGKVVQLHRAHHAITIETGGVQVLLHIGLDTVKLNGEGFKPVVKLGDYVLAGQALIEFDADLIAQKAKSLITIMVVTEVSEKRLHFNRIPFADAGMDVLVSVSEAEATAQSASGDGQAESQEIRIELPTGLHARPAALLVGMAKSYRSNVELLKGEKSANAKSVVGIMGLEIANGDRVRFRAAGADAAQAVAELTEFLHDLEEQPEAATAKPAASVRRASSADSLGGVGVSPGLAIGFVHQVRGETFDFAEEASASAEEEKARLERALTAAADELSELGRQVKAKTDGTQAAIFAAHRELLADPDIVFEADKLMAKGKSAAYAWNKAIETHASRLASLNNELMANRANDLRDVGRRVLRLVSGGKSRPNPLPDNAILIAENLTPSETVALDRSKVLGFCTTSGGATSHVAILARSLGLPAIAGIDPKALEIAEGSEVILDGDLGELRLNPKAADKQAAQKMQAEHASKREAALTMAHKPAVSRDGRSVEVAANIGSVADARQAVEMGADGVGLLRSEFLFLERDTAPSEEEQYRVYQEIADVLGERVLVIRTLDVGGDKPLRYLPIEAEENPFLGVRGIRVGFLHPEILRQQLRAILRVRTRGKLCVMFPMISSLEEFRKAKQMLEEERAKLKAAPVQVGIMVEVPSVALTAEAFAREVDFFSVGTNDLTQYTLAMDRGHTGLAKQVDALHPSVLKLIEMSIQAAHAHGKWVGICGGLASDLKAVPILLGLGVDELSVSIPSVPMVKSTVRECRVSECESLAKRAVGAATATEVRELKVLNPSQGFVDEESVLVPAEDR